ncbi:MAG: hypothetical protein WAU32_15690 [Thermoanaerobaculia bacterium]
MRRLAPLSVSLAAVLAGAGALLLGQSTPAPRVENEELPEIGTRLAALPEGGVKTVADSACLSCHSADIIRQQRLNEKQWAANVTKMIGWGAPVPEDRKDALVAYLLEHFGPDNDRFEPVVVRPPAH